MTEISNKVTALYTAVTALETENERLKGELAELKASVAAQPVNTSNTPGFERAAQAQEVKEERQEATEVNDSVFPTAPPQMGGTNNTEAAEMLASYFLNDSLQKGLLNIPMAERETVVKTIGQALLPVCVSAKQGATDLPGFFGRDNVQQVLTDATPIVQGVLSQHFRAYIQSV